MKVLIACEESQTECMAFRKLGHEAYSCDIQDCSGGHPEWHIKADVLPLLNGNVCFTTCDGKLHFIFGEWDLIIAHPPCTYLTVTGNRWFNEERYGERAKARKVEREIAAEFFMHFVHANCSRIAVENPIGYMSTYYRKPDQISQPYWFGDPERKSTCFWLKNLPPLVPTNMVEPVIIQYKNGKGSDSPWHMATMKLPPAERAKARSKAFAGMAEAMALQWGSLETEGDLNDR